jgi:ketosteroid isomerase-like protein
MASTQTITERENQLYEAMLAFDYQALDDILSDEVSYVHSTGVVETKAAYFAGLRQGLYEYGAITIRSGHTRTFEDVAITRGIMEMLVGANGSAKNTIRLQHVLVWRREAGTWRLLLRQATRLPA